uniref:Uncharacterized protein n=1 Tax=Oryza meridionalis TaxID=40149 RepID=A0A0E0CFF5_9ORYZ
MENEKNSSRARALPAAVASKVPTRIRFAEPWAVGCGPTIVDVDDGETSPCASLPNPLRRRHTR